MTGNDSSDKIKSAAKLSEDGSVIAPMDTEEYQRIKKNLEREGVSVISAAPDSDDERFLKYMGAEAISDDEGILHLCDVPSASAMYQEMIHCTQIREYGSMTTDDYAERAAREVAANRILLQNAKECHFKPQDYEDIERNLNIWEKEFKRVVGVSYDTTDLTYGWELW